MNVFLIFLHSEDNKYLLLRRHVMRSHFIKHALLNNILSYFSYLYHYSICKIMPLVRNCSDIISHILFVYDDIIIHNVITM